MVSYQTFEKFQWSKKTSAEWVESERQSKVDIFWCKRQHNFTEAREVETLVSTNSELIFLICVFTAFIK